MVQLAMTAHRLCNPYVLRWKSQCAQLGRRRLHASGTRNHAGIGRLIVASLPNRINGNLFRIGGRAAKQSTAAKIIPNLPTQQRQFAIAAHRKSGSARCICQIWLQDDEGLQLIAIDPCKPPGLCWRQERALPRPSERHKLEKPPPARPASRADIRRPATSAR